MTKIKIHAKDTVRFRSAISINAPTLHSANILKKSKCKYTMRLNMSTLIEVVNVPSNVCKFPAICPTTVEIYDDHVSTHGQRVASWYYNDFTGISTQKANIFCGYASVIFLNAINAEWTWKNDIPIFQDKNRILFCSGMFSYKPANLYVDELAHKITKTFELYKSKHSYYASEDFSAADEIKKFKELLDAGAITQEEFDVKKKQLL